MAVKMVQKLVYNYAFSQAEIAPLIEISIVSDDVLNLYSESLLAEPEIKEIKEEQAIIAEPVKDVDISKTHSETQKEDTETRIYSLKYYNPKTKKSETLTTSSTIKLVDYVQKNIEEAAAFKSTYPVYQFIAAPLVTTEIDPIKLQQILDEREYGTPPRFGGSAVVKVIEHPSLAPIVEKERESVIEVEKRKKQVEARLDSEIVVLEHAKESIEQGKKPLLAVQEIGPLTKERFIVAIKKKKLTRSDILALLTSDTAFLKSIKEKLRSMKTSDLLEIIRAISSLKEKKP